MMIIPAIDIMDKECVQLVGGDPDTRKFYGNPVEIALEFKNLGAKILHVIDLDAALGTGDNLETVLRICRVTELPIHFGGGIRDIEKARLLLNSGIDRIILGTLAVRDYLSEFTILKKLRSEFGRDRIIVALDSRGGNIVIKGWQETTSIPTIEFMKKFNHLVWGFLYTDVDLEGKMRGINIRRIREIIKSTRLPIIVSGGISSDSDIRKLEKIGAWGVVLGRALYEGRINLRDFSNF